MDTRALVGQLFLLTFPGLEYSGEVKRLVEEDKVGGLMLYGVSGNTAPPGQLRRFSSEVQRAARDHGLPPVLLAVDQEGGAVQRLRRGFTRLPSNMAVAAAGEPENARRLADLAAQELEASGVNCNLAPVVDVNSNPDNPIIGTRSFGSDPSKVGQYGLAAIQGYGQGGVLCSAKHFPGHGDTDVDSHLGLPRIKADRARLERVELPPFRAAMEANVPLVMTAHVAAPALTGEPDLPATLSPEVLTGLLREDMGFEGVVVTDSLFMGAIMEKYGPKEAALRAFEAGADLLLFGADLYVRGRGEETAALQRGAMRGLEDAVRSGRIPRAEVERRVARVLAAKERLPSGEFASGDPKVLSARAGSPEHARLAFSVASKALTLVRDEPGFFPLPSGGGLTVLFPESVPDVSDAFAEHLPWAETLAYPDDPSESEVDALAEQVGERVLLCTLDAGRDPGQSELRRALGEKEVAVAALGSPYDALHLEGTGTYLACYGPHPGCLDALARFTAGETRAQGRLPVDLPGVAPRGAGQFSGEPSPVPSPGSP